VRDLYQILGLDRTATFQEIQRAYRRLAKTAHPDTGGSAEAFSELSTAYAVLSDPDRRRRYDETGEISLPRADTLDSSAFEVIAQKLGLILHAEQDLTALDLGALIEGAIREDMDQRRASIAAHRRAIDRTAALRKRIKRKANGRDNLLARVLDWHEACSREQIRKSELSVSSMERALEILKDYSFAEEFEPGMTGAEVAAALEGALEALDQLAAALKTTGPGWADIEAARPSPSG
jgi:curved DNA-binding protein CbpA